jgi:predicted PurR-regulated permease PerM
MEIIFTIFILSIFLNIFLIRRSFKIMEELQNLFKSNLEYKLYVRDKIQSALTQMREIDERGSFESDDEVGAIFSELKTILQETNEILTNEKGKKE